MILTNANLVELTQRRRRSAQARVLTALGVPFRQRPDGSIVVFESDLHAPPKERSAPPALRLR
ncbi:MAG: DUF4224 domain-containing protein [Rhodocyclaceae bacterium]|jgi:hypothetical protein|nr:DUF4224 domain-containing protein [Rhodocyclaceae bacterium]